MQKHKNSTVGNYKQTSKISKMRIKITWKTKKIYTNLDKICTKYITLRTIKRLENSPKF